MQVRGRVLKSLITALCATAVALCSLTTVAFASAGDDLILGVFTGDYYQDLTNSIYASDTGDKMYRISTAYDGARMEVGPDGQTKSIPYSTFGGGDHYAQVCPSIIYHNGFFYNLSGTSHDVDGKLEILISYSSDLVNWTHPEANFTGNYIALDSLPTVNGIPASHFDIVAPEWGFGSDGSIYLTFCAGYYGDYHGEPTNDQMQAYVAKVTELSATAGNPADGKYQWPQNLTCTVETAKKLPFTNYDGANFIDGAFYAEGDTTYLVIKEGGLTNQIYASATPNDPNSWKLVNGKATFGFEGPSIAKLNNTYYLYTDRVTGATADGVRLATSDSIVRGDLWSTPRDIPFLTSDGTNLLARHGSVITLKAGTPEWQVAHDLLMQNAAYAAGQKFERLRGKDAFKTMAAIVQTGFGDGTCEEAVIATSDNYYDALTAAGFAGIKQCPVLLTNKDSLQDDTRAELERLGVKRVYIAGGRAAVSQEVEDIINGLMGIKTERLAGADAADTAVKIYEKGGKSWGKTAIIATVQGYYDALSVAPYGYAKTMPTFLASQPGGTSYMLNQATLDTILKGGFERVVICGGGAAVAKEVDAQLAGAGFTGAIVRQSGTDACATSVALANFCLGEGMQVSGMGVATTNDYYDALTGAALCGMQNAPLVLVNDNGLNAVNDFIAPHKAEIDYGFIFGGAAAVSANVEAAIIRAVA